MCLKCGFCPLLHFFFFLQIVQDFILRLWSWSDDPSVHSNTHVRAPARGTANPWWHQTGLLGVWPVIFTDSGTSFGKWTCTSFWCDPPPHPTYPTTKKMGKKHWKKCSRRAGRKQNIDNDNILIIKAKNTWSGLGTSGTLWALMEHLRNSSVSFLLSLSSIFLFSSFSVKKKWWEPNIGVRWALKLQERTRFSLQLQKKKRKTHFCPPYHC